MHPDVSSVSYIRPSKPIYFPAVDPAIKSGPDFANILYGKRLSNREFSVKRKILIC